MAAPRASRPVMFGGPVEPTLLPWTWALERLGASRHYWIATTRPDGRPHSRPVWGVVVDGAVFFSTGSRAVVNLAANPAVCLSSEDPTALVTIEGVAVVEADRAVIGQACASYAGTYDEDLDPDHLPGPFHRVVPHVAFGWMSSPTFADGGAVFHGTATRWAF
jgi:hypothetical protein